MRRRAHGRGRLGYGEWGNVRLLGRFAGKQVHVTGFLRARLTWEGDHERRFALGQALESGDDVLQRFETVHALDSAAEFSRGLGSSQQENADDRDLAAIEIEGFLQSVLELGNAAVGAACGSGEALFMQRS